MNNLPTQIHTQVILISDQAVPNLTPVLDKRFKPQRIVMFVSQDMTARSWALEQLFRPRGIQIQTCPVNDPWDIESCRHQMEDWLLEQTDLNSLALNVTGGTKPLAIAAYEVFRENHLPIFYVHPERDHLIWMHPKMPPVDLENKIQLDHYLMAYGAQHVDIQHPHGVPEPLRQLTQHLIAQIDFYDAALSRLNFYAASSGNAQLKSPAIPTEQLYDRAFDALIQQFSDAGILRCQDDSLIFPNETARFFANGGWLEAHVYAACLNLKKSLPIQDVGCSVEVTRQGKNPVKNELDVALLKDNRLYLVECKTKRYAGNGQKHSEADDVLYKLDSIRDVLGGLKAQAMLVSIKNISPAHLSRAKELNIRVCCHRDIEQLENKLSQWLQ